MALATADIVMMLENSVYSVISPEGCASILWRDPNAVTKAAESLKLTAKECFNLNIIDEIIPEKSGGAHRFRDEQYVILKDILISKLQKLISIPLKDIIVQRNEKFLNITND